MTNFNEWDRKAQDLVKEAEEDDQREKAASDLALGLQDGPKGPPTQKADEQREAMGGHSEMRRNFIKEQQEKEVVLDHKGAADTIVVTKEVAGNSAVRLDGCRDVTYQIPAGVKLVKLFVDRCERVKVLVEETLATSWVEVSHCSDIEIRAKCSIATVQCDECTDGPVRIIFSEPEHMATFFHQNSPMLEVALDGEEMTKVGKAGGRQFVTRPGPHGFATEEVIRGKGDFPLNLTDPKAGSASEPDAEASPASEASRAQAEAKRQEGNAAFKANDFLQAALYYTEAIELCPDLHLAWANRAQCFLHTGQPEKALTDATRCTELAPDYAKGWFRMGIALHALRRFGEAIGPLTEAEKLDPKNSQIPEAIKMAQLMCQRHGPDGSH